MTHEIFHYAALGEVAEKAAALHAFIPLQEDLSALYQPLSLGCHRVENRIAFQPMEGTDGTDDGAPGELTCRRYRRFAEAGPGLIWFEAVATVPEGRASAHQLCLTEQNVDDFRRLQFAADFRDMLEKAQSLFYRHFKHIVDVFILIFYLERFAVVARALADLARHVNIGQKVHFNLEYAVALTSLAPAAFDVE